MEVISSACHSRYARLALSSPAYAHHLDYIVCEDGKAIGRMYEDRQNAAGAVPVLVDHGARASG
jgi:hypothetical protein